MIARARHLHRIVLASLGLWALSPNPGLAQTPTEEASQSLLEARAADLAKIVAPSIDAQVEFGRKAFVAGAATAEEAADIYARYPELLPSTWRAIEPDFRAWVISVQAEYQDGLAQIYATHLTVTQIEAIHHFYLTPTGRKALAALHEPAVADPIIADVLDSPDGQISARTVDAVSRRIQRKLVSDLTTEDAAEFALLGEAVPAAKTAALTAAVRAYELEWSNRSDPEFDERIGDKVERFVIRYIEAQRTQ